MHGLLRARTLLVCGPLIGAGAGSAAGSGLGCATAGHTQNAATSSDDGGTIGNTAGPDGGSSGPPAPGPLGIALFGQACSMGSPSVDWSPIRRISRVEYNNMVRDLLGDTTQPANAFPPESPMLPGVNFQTNTYAGASQLILQDYIQTAEALAEKAVSDTNNLNNVLLNQGAMPACSSQGDACAQQFISHWVNRAFRGQLDTAESSALLSFYSDVKGMFGFAVGIQAVITAALESPRFLYVLEFGSPSAQGAAAPLSAYEVAGRLSLFLWRSVPDDTLMSDAANGKLATPAAVLAEAQRMLAVTDAQSGKLKAQDAIEDFTRQWMQLTGAQGKDSQFTAWNANSKLPAEMNEETRLNVTQLVLPGNAGQGGSLTDLLTSPASYINDDLAMFYGVSRGGDASVSVNDPVSGVQGQFSATTLPNRAGILTNGAVLATQAHSSLPSAVLRGKLVRENILCDRIPPPPPNVPAAKTTVPDGGSTRALLDDHTMMPCAQGCHQYMDPIGFGFSNFDATGAYQATDANGHTPAGSFAPIDSSGQVLAMNNGEFQTTFKDATDLATQLSSATQTRQCFALQMFRYALGRIESQKDACSAAQIYSAFSAAKWNIQALMLAVVQSDAFLNRSVQTAGASCQ